MQPGGRPEADLQGSYRQIRAGELADCAVNLGIHHDLPEHLALLQIPLDKPAARLSFMSVLAYDWRMTGPQRTLFKTRLVLIAVALVVAGLAMTLHRLIQ